MTRPKPKKIQILELRCVRGSGGGPEKTIYLTAKKIDSKRFQTHIVYIRAQDDLQFNLMRQNYLQKEDENIKYQELFEKHSFDRSLVHWLVDYCFRKQIDILHSHEYKTDVLAWLVRRRLPVQWVATYHLDYANSFKMRLYRKLDYWVLRKADSIFTVSASLLKILTQKKIPISIMENLPNGIDSEYFDPKAVSSDLKKELGIPSDHVLIGSVGRLAPQKNISLLLRAIQTLIVQGKKVSLILVGDGPSKKEAEEAVEEMEIKRWVHFLGFVSDVRPIYKALDLFVSSSDQEGMPNSILEAMAMAVPVVATKVGGNSEIIENEKEGFLSPAGSLEALIEIMIKLIEGPELRRKIGEAGRKKVEKNFSFIQRVKRLEEIYEKIVQRED